jgi:hypothetical protein
LSAGALNTMKQDEWFVVMDLAGPRDSYKALFDYLGTLGTRKVASNVWVFRTELDNADLGEKFRTLTDKLSALIQSAPHNLGRRLHDKLFVFSYDVRGQFLLMPSDEYEAAGFPDTLSEEDKRQLSVITERKVGDGGWTKGGS